MKTLLLGVCIFGLLAIILFTDDHKHATALAWLALSALFLTVNKQVSNKGRGNDDG